MKKIAIFLLIAILLTCIIGHFGIIKNNIMLNKGEKTIKTYLKEKYGFQSIELENVKLTQNDNGIPLFLDASFVVNEKPYRVICEMDYIDTDHCYDNYESAIVQAGIKEYIHKVTGEIPVVYDIEVYDAFEHSTVVYDGCPSKNLINKKFNGDATTFLTSNPSNKRNYMYTEIKALYVNIEDVQITEDAQSVFQNTDYTLLCNFVDKESAKTFRKKGMPLDVRYYLPNIKDFFQDGKRVNPEAMNKGYFALDLDYEDAVEYIDSTKLSQTITVETMNIQTNMVEKELGFKFHTKLYPCGNAYIYYLNKNKIENFNERTPYHIVYVEQDKDGMYDFRVGPQLDMNLPKNQYYAIVPPQLLQLEKRIHWAIVEINIANNYI
jgi:hypothetical protein